MTDKTKTDLISDSPQNIERPRPANDTADVCNTQNTTEPKLYFGLSVRHWAFLYGLFVATVITWIASQNVTQFKQHGAVAFQDGFPGDLAQWTRKGGWDNILFEQDSIKVNREVDKSSWAVRTFVLTPSENRAQESLNATGLVKTLKKKPVTDKSTGGALMIWLQDDSDKVVKYLNIGKLDGLSDQYEVSRIIPLTENITRFSLVLTNKKTSAEFALVDASVSLVTELPTFRIVRAVIFLVWAIILLFALYYLFIHASKAMFTVIATVISLTIIGILMPDSIRSAGIQPIFNIVQKPLGLDSDSGLSYAFKAGHFVFFFLCTLILLLYRKTLKLLAWEIFLLMTLFAIATEGLQLYLSDRTTRITDLIIDFSAIVLGTLLAALIIAIKAIRSKKSKLSAAAQEP